MGTSQVNTLHFPAKISVNNYNFKPPIILMESPLVNDAKKVKVSAVLEGNGTDANKTH